ncbi:MAG: rsfS [Solirubrobacterales bacterium]|jgi:ribosome-associated protein|nr:rsfS [Solirubrobacterales bacterium]
MNPEELTQAIAGYAADKKAIDPIALDLRGVAGYTDVFLICSGNTERQVKAIHDGINEGMKKDHRVLPRRVEGTGEATWILLDYLDVVVHVFTPQTRSFYRLEQLWGDVPRLALDVPAGDTVASVLAGEGADSDEEQGDSHDG